MVNSKRETRNTKLRRCRWAGTDERMIAYHDREWGKPLRNERRLFEFLVLEGAQAGLSWSTILNKRENYRRAFHRFDPVRVARYGARDRARLLKDAGIVRNRAKIAAAVVNARAFLGVQQDMGSFSRHVWSFVGGRPIVNRRRSPGHMPAFTEESVALSRDLAARGFRFVGPTIMYAFMQAVGMVNDHDARCFRHRELSR
jgi:DNA-3-methyladenine glycosylase I